MSNPSPDDFLEAEIESTLAPYRAMGLSPALLLEMANLLRMALTSDPTGRYLMSRARPRAAEQSGAQTAGSANGAAKLRSVR